MCSDDDFACRIAATLEKRGWKRDIAGEDFDLAVRIWLKLEEFPEKGLVLSGPFGAGKTSFVKSLFPGIRTLTMPMDELMLDPRDDYDPCQGTLLIDDVGAEHLINAYGVRSEKFADLIVARHMVCKRGRLMITTNLSTADFDRRYGGRVVSRLKDMCFAAHFSGKDKREWNIIK